VAQPRFRTPKGTHDVLPPESERWTLLERQFSERAATFGFERLYTPMFEDVEVFQRLGEGTDVVAKEMYEFADRAGRRLALRPEGTAPVVRAFVEHRPKTPWRIWYSAPNFRYERAQKGRYRQHWQLGVEVLGVRDADVDVEVIDLAHGFYRDLGLKNVNLRINSMGDAASRSKYAEVLRGSLSKHADELGAEFRQRVEENALRVLDSKNPEWQDVVERAPQLYEFLAPEAQQRFSRVQSALSELGIEFEIDPRLVRGFDYYTDTVFEFTSPALEAAQNAVGGGGRYDGLVEELGGPPTPGIGFGIGVERLLLACDAEHALPIERESGQVVLVNVADDPEAVVLLHELRGEGVSSQILYQARDVKDGLRIASRMHAHVAVLFLPELTAKSLVGVKDLRSQKQEDVPTADALARVLKVVSR
jgi:histidyl-tRNA synthetase